MALQSLLLDVLIDVLSYLEVHDILVLQRVGVKSSRQYV